MELSKEIRILSDDIKKSIKSIDIENLEKQQRDLADKSQAADFWEDSKRASSVMKELADLQETIEGWRNLEKEVNELMELVKIGDDSMAADLESQLKKLKKQYSGLQTSLAFNGEYDNFDVILTIRSGAGGTDAQDWAQMLLRMYSRWGEANNYKVIVLDESPGEEAGIKSASIQISGKYAYGRLKSEHGVHRLVRLSPYNADNLRQTSFAKVEIMPKIDRPETVPIDEKDIKVDVFRAGGHGGQSVNTTDSAVRITHLPTGIVVSIQNERSQLQNRETAMTILRSRLAALQLEQHEENLSKLKGPNQSAEWGNQIRSYVLHPYTMVKDLRTKHETSNAQAVLDGDLNSFIEAYIKP